MRIGFFREARRVLCGCVSVVLILSDWRAIYDACSYTSGSGGGILGTKSTVADDGRVCAGIGALPQLILADDHAVSCSDAYVWEYQWAAVGE